MMSSELYAGGHAPAGFPSPGAQSAYGSFFLMPPHR